MLAFDLHLRAMREQGLQTLRRRQEARVAKQRMAQHQFQPDDYVMHRYERYLKKSKFSPRWLGPYKVLRQDSNHVTVMSLVDDTEAVLHHDRCTIFHGNEDAARRMAAIDVQEMRVSSILAHRGCIDQRAHMAFYTVFENGEREWLEYAKIHNTVLFESYCQKHPYLEHAILRSVTEYAEWTRQMNVVPIADLHAHFADIATHLPVVGTTYYIPIAAWLPGKPLKTMMQLPDIEVTEYCFPAILVRVTTKTVVMHIPLLSKPRYKHLLGWKFSVFRMYCLREQDLREHHIVFNEDILKLKHMVRPAIVPAHFARALVR
jgi:hypothetical protein